ncbi:ComEC/Rec2-related protein [Acidimicrobiia bacterium]
MTFGETLSTSGSPLPASLMSRIVSGSEWRTLFAVAAAVLGSVLAFPVPLMVVVAAALIVMLRRTILSAAVLITLVTSMGAASGWAGLVPVDHVSFEGNATLMSDPTSSFGSWRARVRTSEGYFELHASGRTGAMLRQRQAGQRITMSGRFDDVTSKFRDPSKHVRGRLIADQISSWNDGGVVARFVNAVRSTVLRGADSFPGDQRALFGGFVLGDDRGASEVVKDDFKASGLSHLLVVSGQNLAFVMIVLSPLLSRLGLRMRFLVTTSAVVLFAAMTRFEPSILRASAMVCVAVVFATVGRPTSGLRVLGIAVIGLLVIDPLLVHSVGFRLSVAATAGIVLLSRKIAAWLPLPRYLAMSLAVTISAQVAVAPLLIPMFGPMPLVSLPANVLAEPAAALVMMWGCTGGVIAGLVGPEIASVVHFPTRLGLWWVMTVSRIGASVPAASVGFVGGALIGVGVIVIAVARRIVVTRWMMAALTISVAAFVLLSISRPATVVPGEHQIGGATLWRGSGSNPANVLVVSGSSQTGPLLTKLRSMGIDHVDLVIVRSVAPAADRVVREIRSRVEIESVWAPTSSRLESLSPLPEGPVVGGSLRITLTRSNSSLEPSIELMPTPG